MALSRRHKVETDAAAKALTIFGGKLTDCLNVAEEVVSEARRMGIALKPHDPFWHGALNVRGQGPEMKTSGPPLIKLGGEQYTRADVERMTSDEMIVTEEDFLRRRTALALKAKKSGLLNHQGLREACGIIFGEDAYRSAPG